MSNMEESMKKQLGLKGKTKMALKLLLRPDLRKAMKESERIFKDYFDYIGYGYVTGRKK